MHSASESYSNLNKRSSARLATSRALRIDRWRIDIITLGKNIAGRKRAETAVVPNQVSADQAILDADIQRRFNNIDDLRNTSISLRNFRISHQQIEHVRLNIILQPIQAENLVNVDEPGIEATSANQDRCAVLEIGEIVVFLRIQCVRGCRRQGFSGNARLGFPHRSRHGIRAKEIRREQRTKNRRFSK